MSVLGEKSPVEGLQQLYVEDETEGDGGRSLNLGRQSEACCFFPGRGTFPHLEHMFAALPISSLVGRWNKDKTMRLLSGQLYVNAHSGLYQHALSCCVAVLGLAAQSFGKWLQLSLGVSLLTLKSSLIVLGLQHKEQSEYTLFVQMLPRTSQHHFSANLRECLFTCLASQGCPRGEKNLRCKYQERVVARKWTEDQFREIPGQNLDLQLASVLTPRYATASVSGRQDV
jgi:hypothetical protein